MTGPAPLGDPEQRTGDAEAQTGDTVWWGARTMILLGRTASGGWMLLPAHVFMTPLARRAAFVTHQRPRILLPRIGNVRPAKAVRDRRGAWTRYPRAKKA